jgi:hypothetical protein
MPGFTHVRDLVPPEPPDLCELAVFPVAVVPYALAALEHRIPPYVWADDHELRGTQLIRSLQVAILCGGMTELLESQDRVYRLLATALYGDEYEVTSTDPVLVVEPQIWPTHDIAIVNPDSILGRMEDMKQLLQNALNGTATTNYDRVDGIRDILEQLLLAVQESDDLDPEIVAKLAELVVLLA